MTWYYADDNNQQLGPVTEDELTRLAGAGTVDDQTLVWRDGMPDWAPYGHVRAAGSGALPALGTGICRHCGQTCNREDLVDFGGTLICARCKPAYLQQMREGGHTVGDVEYAGFWIRFAAKFIDGVLMGIVSFIIMFFTMGMASMADPEEVPVAGFVLYYVLAFGVNIAYYVWFHGKFGATPGKMACRIKVITADGEPISYGRSFGRFFGDLLSAMILYIGYIMVAFDGQKRALHDHICNTRVIKRA